MTAKPLPLLTLCALAAALVALPAPSAAADIRVGYTLDALTLDPATSASATPKQCCATCTTACSRATAR